MNLTALKLVSCDNAVNFYHMAQKLLISEKTEVTYKIWGKNDSGIDENRYRFDLLDCYRQKNRSDTLEYLLYDEKFI